uniref:Uncharacterized protein n=1 Tax=uncultured Thiotrichaceae bacterium TaxID=298394 RepID=A0A6S6SI01_9GAMM|nr:MAG: Unknown protein [uncultured Thiotrichaceae bacterium]
MDDCKPDIDEFYSDSNSQLEPPPILAGGFVPGLSMKAIR